MAKSDSIVESREIKIIPRKIEGTTRGVRKLKKYLAWTCDLERTMLDGSKRLTRGSTFMKPQKLKRDALKVAKEYADYMRSKGDFYFVVHKDSEKLNNGGGVGDNQFKKGDAFNTPSGVYYIIRFNSEGNGMLESYDISRKSNARKGVNFSPADLENRLKEGVWVNVSHLSKEEIKELPPIDVKKLSNGGGVGDHIDLFEHYDKQPADLRLITEKWEEKHMDGELDYIDTANFLQEVESIGYTFDYGLDNEPFNLRKIGTTGNSDLMRDGGKVKKGSSDDITKTIAKKAGAGNSTKKNTYTPKKLSDNDSKKGWFTGNLSFLNW